MDLQVSVQCKATLYTTVLYLTVVTLFSTVSSQRCTTAILDPQNVSSYDPSRLVPLRGQDAEVRYPFSEQWIFPNLQFTCFGLLTKWIFTGVPGQAAASCRVELETWRLAAYMSGTDSTVFQRRSTTERSRVTIKQDGPIFTYELASPVLVEPGDIVGVELERLCIMSEDFDNVLSFNISGTGSSYLSYRQDGSESTFYLHPLYTTTEQDFIPLIEAVVEPFREFTGSIDIRTLSATERVTTGPDTDQSEGTSVTTIAAAIIGGIIGVIITVVVCVCVWCIARHVSCNKERRQSNASKQQQQQRQQQLQDGSINMISMQQNEAYTEPRVYHTAMGIPEQAVQPNRAHGLRGEECVEIKDTEETGDEYERMYAANHDAIFRPNARELEKCSNFAKSREYELPFQQRDHSINEEDNEHAYEYI